ncbi:hypothetical protein J7L70_07095 [Candidatus Bathyarchaeota archaeon]|nr:hypothetical protein [Candidatus Bathyarchaeota archaeon]
MSDKTKTGIVVDRKIWEEFRSKVGSERGLKMLSHAVEEAIEEEVGEVLVMEAFEKLLACREGLPLTVTPIKPRVPTDSGKAVRELRGLRI